MLKDTHVEYLQVPRRLYHPKELPKPKIEQQLPKRQYHSQYNTDTLISTQPVPSNMWSTGDAEFSQMKEVNGPEL